MTKELYEFINPSDAITFYAENDTYARAVTLFLGNGKAGCRKRNGEYLDHCLTVFNGEAPAEVYDGIKEMVDTKDKCLLEALNSVAVCRVSDREAFDVYTENCTNEERWQNWDEKHRTSTNNFGQYARDLAQAIKTKGENNG